MNRQRSLIAIVLFSLAGISTLFTNCGTAFQTGEIKVSSTSAIPAEPIDTGEVIPTVSALTAPANAPTYKCSTKISVSIADLPASPQVIDFPPGFREKIFTDAECLVPIGTKVLKTAGLVTDFYFRSEEIMQQDFYVTVGGMASNKIAMNVYRADFSSSDSSSGGAFFMNDDLTRFQRNFALVGGPNPTADVFAPNFTNTAAPATANPPKLLSSPGANRRIGFNENGLYSIDTLVNSDRVNALIQSTKIVGTQTVSHSCYASKNEVYCSNDFVTFTKIALPPGAVTDLQSALTMATCAVVGGKVYCWGTDNAVVEMTKFLDDVKQVTVNILRETNGNVVAADFDRPGTRLCALKTSGKVFCTVNGTVTDMGLDKIRRIGGGGTSTLYFSYERFDPAVKFSSFGIMNMTTQELRPFPVDTRYDEIKIISGTTALVQGCARNGKDLICFKAATGDAMILTQKIDNVSYTTAP